MSADIHDDVRPQKRPRTTDSDAPPQSSTIGITDLDSLKHHEEFWFDDGSIVLIAGHTAFRVYRALLAAQSTIFTNMLSSSTPDAEEMVEGCPVVHISDSPEDVAHFLRVLLPKSQRTLFSREFSFSFHQISAIIRLAHKYHVQDVLDQAIASLREYFTSNFEVWESHTNQGIIKFRPQQAIGIVNLARLVDRPSLLPTALYKCALLGRDVLNGYKREDKTVEHLPRKDAKRCIDGRIKLAEEALAIIAEVFTTQPCEACKNGPMPCRAVLQAMLGDAVGYKGALSPSVLRSWKEVVSDWAQELGLCDLCEKAAIHRDFKARKRVWDSLPKIFDVDVDGWVPSGGDGGDAAAATT
ncbi:hypothetical protein LXA43DRAFT_37560 [Ganoderma leucocontextum]|nr:hypothetical protein LXA43DRAFT_37560 [Ganoderma leucocontextum]